MGRLFGLLPWWGQALAGIAVFAAIWGAVHLVEEHFRDQGRKEVQTKWDAKTVADEKLAARIQLDRVTADKAAVRQAEELIAIRGKIQDYETNYGNNLIAQLRGLRGVSNPAPSTNGKPSADLSDLSRCVNVATGAIETAVRNYTVSERNADKLDALQARIETDRAAFYKAIGVKDDRPPTDAPQRLAARRQELEQRAKVISQISPLTRSIMQ